MDAVPSNARAAGERGDGQLQPTQAATEVLRSLRLFRMLSDEEFASLAPSVQQRSFRPGAYIVRAGEESPGLYIVLSGRVEIVLHDEECRELILRVFHANDFFGEKTVMHPGAHSESARACEPCEVLYIRQKAVAECLLRNRGALAYVMQVVADRVRTAENKISELAFCDVHMRVASALVDASLEADGAWIVATSSERIARLVGASREMVCRVIKNMIRRGLVRRHKRTLIVLDRASLMNASSRSGRSCGQPHADAAGDCLVPRAARVAPEYSMAHSSSAVRPRV
jgi:CRP/FNR family transcriptional regulator, cyclic AMP receptor protein